MEVIKTQLLADVDTFAAVRAQNKAFGTLADHTAFCVNTAAVLTDTLILHALVDIGTECAVGSSAIPGWTDAREGAHQVLAFAWWRARVRSLENKSTRVVSVMSGNQNFYGKRYHKKDKSNRK